MKRKHHEIFGIVLWIIFIFYAASLGLTAELLLAASFIALIACFVGSIIPDIDCKDSGVFTVVQSLLFVTAFSASAFFLWNMAENKAAPIAARFIAGVVAALVLRLIIPKHRGPIHTLGAGAVYGIICAAAALVFLNDVKVAFIIGFFGFLGFASHLALDGIMK